MTLGREMGMVALIPTMEIRELVERDGRSTGARSKRQKSDFEA